MWNHLHDLEQKLRCHHAINDSVLQAQSGGAIAFPLTGESLVTKPANGSQARRAGNDRDVFPLLVALLDLEGRGTQLLVETRVLLNTPHAIVYLDHIWYVKRLESAA